MSGQMSLKCPDKTPSKKEIKNKLLQCNGNVTKSNIYKNKKAALIGCL